MSSICEDQELLDSFLAEATELLEKIDDDLVTLEQSPCDMDLLNRIFRSIHTVKGAASFLEFELLVKVTHNTEDVLNKRRRGELTLTPGRMDVSLEAVDLVKVLINDIKADEIAGIIRDLGIESSAGTKSEWLQAIDAANSKENELERAAESAVPPR